MTRAASRTARSTAPSRTNGLWRSSPTTFTGSCRRPPRNPPTSSLAAAAPSSGSSWLLAIAAYEPDFNALNAGSSRIVPAVGDASRGELAHEGGLRLAARLGTEAVVFPGAHGGFESHAPEFAVRLREVLQD